MRHDIKAAFDQIHADDSLKRNTEAFLRTKMQRAAGSVAHRKKIGQVVAACLALLLIGWGGHAAYFTPTAVISIDINPSIELEINRFDRVIAARGFNEDGKALVQSLDLLFAGYDAALDRVMQSDAVETCLARDGLLSIAVVPLDARQGERILSYASECTSGHRNVHCYGMDASTLEQAHALGLSCGKYGVYAQIAALDPEITPEDVRNMTMRELRALLESLQSGDSNGRESMESDLQSGDFCESGAHEGAAGNGRQHRSGR